MYRHYQDKPEVQEKVKRRWDFIQTESVGLAYLLTPRFAAEGFFVDHDKVDIIQHIARFLTPNNLITIQQARSEFVNFIAKMSTLEGERKELIFSMSAMNYWTVIGREEFPTLYTGAKQIFN